MTTIQIAHEVPADIVNKISKYLDETAIKNINWNGADFVIERDEYTCIPNDESADAVNLLIAIDKIIDGREV